MRVHPSILIAAISLIAVPSSAQSRDGTMKDMPGMHGAGAVKTGQGVGLVTAVDQRSGGITIKHGAIPAVGWPAMTMTFHATPPSILKNIRIGQSVIFDVRANGMDAQVTSLRPR